MVPSTLTEKITDTTSFRFNIRMAVAGNTLTNSSTLLIENFVFTQISNYSASYTIFAGDGLPLFPAFIYPECPVFKGP